MKNILKAARFLMLFLLIAVLLPVVSKVNAQEYTQAVNAIYSIDESYKVQLIYNVSLTNQTDDRVLKTFKLTLPFNVGSAESKYKTDPLSTTVEKQDKNSVISVALKQIVGKGKVNDFTIVVNDVDIIKKQGNLTNLFIPGIKISEGNTYTVAIEKSKKVQNLNYSSSNYINLEDKPESIKYTFDSNALLTSGLLVIFGDRQNYDFEFNYKIDDYTKNYVNDSDEIKLALPYDNAYQDIYYTQISPAPKNSYKDEDGNYIAVFDYNSLKNKSPNQIIFKGNAYVKQKTDALKTQGAVILNDNQKKIYTSKQDYWDTDAQQVKEILATVIQGKERTRDKAKAIYDYTVATLKYSKDELNKKNRERLGGLKAIQNPTQAICQEYADLFVSLSRAAGIPSRVIVGLAQPPEEAVNPLTTQTVLHAWVQFYDEESQNWINADPTWQSTSNGEIYFDRIGSNHFEMYINGVSSKTPIIPLSFTPEDNEKTLKLSSSDKFEVVSGNEIEINLNKTIVDTTLSDKINVNIKNKTLQVVQISSINLNNAELDKSKLKSNQIMFPTTDIDLEAKVKKKNVFGEEPKTITAEMVANTSTIPEIKVTKDFNIVIKGSPLILWGLIIGGLIILVFLVFLAVALIKRYKYNKK